MAIATPCTSFGFAVDAEGNLVMDGPRPVPWIGGTDCPIATNNGLKYDPDTGKVWVAPADTVSTFTVTHADSPINMVSGLGGNHDLGSFSVTHTGRVCTPSLWTCNGFNNYAQFRMANGNHWRVVRTMSLLYNGGGLGSVSETVMSVENGTGAGQILGIGMPAPSYFFQAPIQNGDTIQLTVAFVLVVDQYTASSGNDFTMRWPDMQSIMWSHA